MTSETLNHSCEHSMGFDNIIYDFFEHHMSYINLAEGEQMYGSPDIALKLSCKFVSEMKLMLPVFKTNVTNQHWDNLLEHCHKQHGAACYANTPDLKDHLNRLECCIKENMTKLATGDQQIIDNIGLLMVAIDNSLTLTQKKLEQLMQAHNLDIQSIDFE